MKYKYFNGNNFQVTVKSPNDPEKVYYLPARATLTLKEPLKELPAGVRAVSETNSKKK